MLRIKFYYFKVVNWCLRMKVSALANRKARAYGYHTTKRFEQR